MIVDAGGWSERRADNREIATRVFLEGMQELGLQVANVAGRDLIGGPEEFDALRAGIAVHFVSANIHVDAQPLVERFHVYERQLNGRTVRIGVTGVTSPSRTALEQWKNTPRALDFRDPVEAAGAVLDEMRASTDIQVLLAELPPRILDQIVAAAEGYDLLISSLGRLQETTPLGPTPAMIAPGNRCKQLAWVNVQLNGDQVEIVGGEVVDLDEKVEDHPATAARVLELKERVSAAAGNPEGRVSATEAEVGAVARPRDSAISP